MISNSSYQEETQAVNTQTLNYLKIRRPFLLFILLLTLLACNVIATPEPPGVGEKSELGYAVCDPIIAALEQFQADKGAYPESLVDLAPDYIASIPTEVNDEPVTYSKTEESYSLQFHYIGPGMNTCEYTPEDKWQCSGAY